MFKSLQTGCDAASSFLSISVSFLSASSPVGPFHFQFIDSGLRPQRHQKQCFIFDRLRCPLSGPVFSIFHCVSLRVCECFPCRFPFSSSRPFKTHSAVVSRAASLAVPLFQCPLQVLCQCSASVTLHHRSDSVSWTAATDLPIRASIRDQLNRKRGKRKTQETKKKMPVQVWQSYTSRYIFRECHV